MYHGDRCRTRTYPTTCPTCYADVFYFSCDCGSKVFFEALGHPWPQHRCGDHITYERVIEVVGGKEALARGLKASMTTLRIEGTYARRIGRAVRRPRPSPSRINREDPYDGLEAEETGVVREFIPDVDMYRRFGVPATAMGAALLGELGRARFDQITIHTGALGDEDDFSFTFFIDASTRASIGIGKGNLVRCALRGVAIPDRDPVWRCERIDLIGRDS